MKCMIAEYQEHERWKSCVTAIVAGCCISRAKGVSLEYLSSKKYSIHLFIESLTGNWHLLKTRDEISKFSKMLDLAFPAEAGKRGHERCLPVRPKASTLLAMLRGQEKMESELKEELLLYFGRIVGLPAYISRSRLVLEFFLPPEFDASPTGGESELGSRPASTIGETITLSHDDCVPSLQPESLIPSRVKFVWNGERYGFDYDSECAMSVFINSVQEKTGVCLRDAQWTYRDEDDDEIIIRDEEDLYSAISMLGSKLCICIDSK